MGRKKGRFTRQELRRAELGGVRGGIEKIKDDYGIELTTHEMLGLDLYIQSFKRTDTKTPHADALHWFIVDYFGLDNIELGLDEIPMQIGCAVKNHVKYGLDLLGTPEFKEYCRRNVDFWREERGPL